MEPLIKALSESTAFDVEALREMGANGRKLVEDKYTWDVVVKNMIAGYEIIIRPRATP